VRSFRKVLFFLACLVPAPLLFGGAVFQRLAPTQVELPPQVTEILAANPDLGLYEIVVGINTWDLSREMYDKGVDWPLIYGWNVQAGLMKVSDFESRPGNQPYHIGLRPGQKLILATSLANGIPDIVRPYAATAIVPVVSASPAVAEATGTNWWLWWLLFVALVMAVILFADNRRLRDTITYLRTRLDATDREFSDLMERHRRELEEQRAIDFAARRSNMPPLPDGVEDGVMTGPPMHFEGVTEENRNRVFNDAVRFEYQRLHQGAQTDGLVFTRTNVRHVLVSSRPGQTFQVSFGDGESREVTLVREPGWIFDATISRNGEIIQELENICVLGFCANVFEYRRSWIVGAHVEPYEYAAVHTNPNWEQVEADRAARRVTVRPLGDKVVASIGENPIVEGDFIVLDTAEEATNVDGDIAIGERMRLRSGVTVPVEVEPESVADEGADSESVAEGAAITSTPE
jgi:hypothetical protein